MGTWKLVIARTQGDGGVCYFGYYFDAETGLYYLKSRYYDPETGRFINADSIDYLNPKKLNGLNLYAYCLNNPIMMADASGHNPYLVLLALLAGVFASAQIVRGAQFADYAAKSGASFWEIIEAYYTGKSLMTAEVVLKIGEVFYSFGESIRNNILLPLKEYKTDVDATGEGLLILAQAAPPYSWLLYIPWVIVVGLSITLDWI